MRVFEETYKKIKTIIPLITVTNWSAFTNQPTNDGVEIISDSASDTMQCTIWGTTNGRSDIVSETVTLTGTDAVSTTKTDWGNIYAVLLANAKGELLTAATGTITVREASGNATITTIGANAFHSGMFIIKADGMNIDIENFTGNLWYSTVKPVTSTNGMKAVGKTNINLNVDTNLYLISDNTGASLQLCILKN